MLIGEMANHTMELTKSANQSTQSDVLRVEHLPSCYHTVVAFDIESDGTTGNLPIPGHLQRNTDIPCTTTEPVNTSLGKTFPLYRYACMPVYVLRYIHSTVSYVSTLHALTSLSCLSTYRFKSSASMEKCVPIYVV